MSQADTRSPAPPADPLDIIRMALANLRFGSLSVTVHDGRVVQIEITEKRRFPAN